MCRLIGEQVLVSFCLHRKCNIYKKNKINKFKLYDSSFAQCTRTHIQIDITRGYECHTLYPKQVSSAKDQKCFFFLISSVMFSSFVLRMTWVLPFYFFLLFSQMGLNGFFLSTKYHFIFYFGWKKSNDNASKSETIVIIKSLKQR